MSCWSSAKSDHRTSTEEAYFPASDTREARKESQCSLGVNDEPKMNSNRFGAKPSPIQRNGTDRSSDYDTPPWRVDTAMGLTSSNGGPTVTGWDTPRSMPSYEPDVTSWKIGPPLLGPRLNSTSSSDVPPLKPTSDVNYNGTLQNAKGIQKHCNDDDSLFYRLQHDQNSVTPNGQNIIYESISNRHASVSTRSDSFSSWKPNAQAVPGNRRNGHFPASHESDVFQKGQQITSNGIKTPSNEWAWRPATPAGTLTRIQRNGISLGIPTENEYTNGSDSSPNVNRPTSNGGVSVEDYFNRLFQEIGTGLNADVNFGVFPRNDRSNTIGSSGYGSISSPLPSPFSPPIYPLPATPSPTLNTIKGRPSKLNTQAMAPNVDDMSKKCIDAGVLFRDEDFHASDKSLYFSHPPPVQGRIEWKRPFEICEDPQFVSGGSDRFDVVQGQIGNCWLVSAIAGLTLNPKLLEKVCPGDQSFRSNYSGAFRFRFWRFGKWVDVLVDDKLPTVRDRLIYLHSSKTNEFWSALLEKAYAKVSGSYEALEGGCTSEGFTDFTGGIVESLHLNRNKNDWNILWKAYKRDSFMGCGINGTPGGRELGNGLVCGHAYSVTCLTQFQIPNSFRPLQLIRLRNPWGTKHEWNGAWSDRSPEWQQVPDYVKNEMELIARADGEFWMSFEDFRSIFHTVDICHLPPDCTAGSDKWQVIQKEGVWEPGVTSGGCCNYSDTFSMNPQYRVSLSEPDDDAKDGLCTLIVSITQKGRRKGAKEGLKNLTIGYSILKAPPGTTGLLDAASIQRCERVSSVPCYVNSRDISQRHELSPGDYVVIPTTFKPNTRGEFLLRLYTEKIASHQELDDDIVLSKTEIVPLDVNSSPLEKKKAEVAIEAFDLLAGEDGEIDAWELKKVLNKMFSKEFPGFEGFGVEAARSMIARNDGDLTGTLSKEEFVSMYRDLNGWKKAFKEHDVDETGTINIQELRGVLQKTGFKVTNRLLVAISRRYSNKQGQIDVQDFVLCMCKLETMIRTFHANQPYPGSNASFPMEEFMISTLYS